MRSLSRRGVLAAGGTLAAALAPRKPRAEDLDPVSAVLKVVSPRQTPSPITFLAADGTPHELAEFVGHGMVVNLWATWCGPCVAELPALSALSKALAPQDIAVLPLSSDRGGAGAVRAFFDKHAITGLPVLLDPKGAVEEAWGARGIPTTVIIDRKGMVCARAEGAADWADPAAAALVKQLVG